MHDALCGERKHTSKAHVEGIWRPEKNMTEISIARGPHFKTLGKADTTGTLWLLPEETIYMVERGSLECWWEEGVPMTMQGVYASCLEAAGGLERYQVYAYLKRSGFNIQRAPTFFDDGMRHILETLNLC
jgi:tRNA-splicing endonuclease subunit Sen54